MYNSMLKCRGVVLLLATSAVAAACSKKPANQQTASGAVDTATLNMSAATPSAGPAAQVTRTDAKSVSRATDYELTAENFSKFLAAADSVVTLEARDSAARAYLSHNLTDAGASDADAGLRYLEANDAVSNAINGAGLSVKDYFVQSIAIAAAERFMKNPKAAPPTPTLRKNAEFLRGHQAELTRLQNLREGKPAVTVTP
jgi:hypothetical protein